MIGATLKSHFCFNTAIPYWSASGSDVAQSACGTATYAIARL
jgi:hypothetical protein